MADNVWSSTGNTDANVGANWSLGHVPTTGETAVWNGTSVVNCTLSAAMAADAYSCTTAYTGAITMGSYAVSAGDMTWNIGTGGTVAMGSSAISCSGNFRCDGATGTLTRTTSVITLTGTANRTVALGNKFSAVVVVNMPASGAITWTSGDTITAGGAWTMTSLTQPAGVTMDMGNGYSHSISGDVTLDGAAFDWGDLTTTTIGGSLDVQHVTAITRGTSTVVLTGTSKNLAGTGAVQNDFHNLTISPGASYTATVGTIVRGTLAVNGSLSVNVGQDVYSYIGYLTVGVSGSISGLGTLRVYQPGSGNGVTSMLGTITIASVSVSGMNAAATLTPATYGAGTFTIVNSGTVSSTWTPSAGAYAFTGNLAVTCNNASATTTINNATNNPNITIGGNLTFTQSAGTLAYTAGSGTLTLTGGNSTITTLGKTLEAIVVNKTATANTLTLGDSLTCASFTLTQGTLECANLLTNGGFETAGAGGADVFANWAETAGTGGTITRETSVVFAGSASAKLASGSDYATRPIVGMYLNWSPSTTYTLSFWTRGDGTNAGRISVYDSTHSANITNLTSTRITGTTWTYYSHTFTTPAGCTSGYVYLAGPAANGGYCYFDNACLSATGYSITATGAITIGVNGQVSAATLAGATWTAASFVGTGVPGTPLLLNPASGWTLTVSGSNRANSATIAQCNAGGGATLVARGSTNGGSNTNVTFSNRLRSQFAAVPYANASRDFADSIVGGVV